MFKSFPRSLAAAGLSVAIALGAMTVSTTQARADNDNLHTFLGAAAGLIILGNILENRHDNRHYYGHPPATRYVAPGLHPVPRRIAPNACFHRFRGPNSLTLNGFGAHCLRSHVPHHAALPDRCLEHVFTYQGWRYVYDAQCLYRHGWVRS